MGVESVTGVEWVIDKSRYFTTLELTQRLDLIFHLIENIQIIPIIRGPEGIGKSTLAQRVRQSAPPYWAVCLLEVDATFSPERLLANISRGFGWIDQQGDALEGLVDCLITLRDDGQVPVLMIDDAQLLPATALIIVLRLFERQYNGEPLISIVLLADDQIDPLLATPQLRIMTPQAIQIIDLPPLNREDATRYMHFLLQQEGVPVDVVVDDTRLTRLYRATRGMPGPLRQSILEALSDRKSPSGGQILKKPIGVVLGILGLTSFGTILMFQDRINQFFDSPPTELTQERQSLSADSSTEMPAVVKAPTKAVVMDGPLSMEVAVMEPPQEVDPRLEAAALVEDQTNLVISDTPPEAEGSVTSETLSLQDQREVITVLEHPEPEQADTTLVSESPDVTADAPISPEPKLSEDSIASAEVESKVTQVVPSSVDVEVKPVTASLRAHAKPSPPHDSLERSDWIRNRPASHYTLQLLGGENLKTLKVYVARHGLQGKAYYYVTRRKGKPWYPLMWGDFPDKKGAIKGSEQLPSEIQRNGYWIRQFKDVQSQLKKNS